MKIKQETHVLPQNLTLTSPAQPTSYYTHFYYLGRGFIILIIIKYRNNFGHTINCSENTCLFFLTQFPRAIRKLDRACQRWWYKKDESNHFLQTHFTLQLWTLIQGQATLKNETLMLQHDWKSDIVPKW